MSQHPLIIPRSLRQRQIDRAFARACDLTSLMSAVWEVADRALDGQLEFVELAIPELDDKALLRHVVARGPLDIGHTGQGCPTPILEEWSKSVRGVVPVADAMIEVIRQYDPERAGTYDATRPYAWPLKSQGETEAAIILGLPAKGGHADEARLVRMLSRRLSPAVHRRLNVCFEAQQRLEQAAHLLSLVRLQDLLGVNRQPMEIAGIGLDYFVTDLGFTRTLLARMDAETRTLYGVDSRGFEDIVRLVRFPVESSDDFLSVAARAGTRAIVELTDDDPSVPVIFRERKLGRTLLLPLHAEGQVIGVLLAEMGPRHRQMTTVSLDNLERIADLFGQSVYMAAMYESLRRSAETDPLTGVYNRLALSKIMGEEIPRAKRYNQALSLLMIDICDFKKFNDLYGHVVGDQILKTTARILIKCTRKSDRVVRYGGDEFLILMPNTPEEKAEMVKERIETAVRESNEAAKAEHEMFMLSIGLRSAQGDKTESIVEDADQAMYKRKAAQSRQKLYNALTSNNEEDLQKSDNFVSVLVRNLVEREPHFLEHARMVMLWCQAICQRIGADDDMIERISLAALLHDVGKISMPSGLLTKQEPLTKEDWHYIRQHPTAGSDFLAGHEFLSDLRMIINHHHERWDGHTSGDHPGYPSGLSGEMIPLGSRIIRVAETFDDLVGQRPYRPRRLTPDQAIQVLRNEAGHSLDPSIVAVFAAYLEMVHQPLGMLA